MTGDGGVPRWLRVGGGVVAAAAFVVGALWVREATLTHHEPVSPSSRLEVTLHAGTGAERAGHPAIALVEALVAVCQLEVGAALDGDVARVGEDTYRFVLRPSLDDADRRQFRGCVSDFRVDHVLASDVQMRDVGDR